MGSKGKNVCAIRRDSDGYYYQENMEHGAGWTERIRQAWTEREAQLIVMRLFERGWEGAGSASVVELDVKREEACREA